MLQPKDLCKLKPYADKLLLSVPIRKCISLQNFIMPHEICRGLTIPFSQAPKVFAVINNFFSLFAFNISDLKVQAGLALELYSLKLASKKNICCCPEIIVKQVSNTHKPTDPVKLLCNRQLEDL